MSLTLNDLQPDLNNPRTIAPDNLERLTKMIGVYGDLAGITWNKRTGKLVGGHQRMTALKNKYGEENMKLAETRGDTIEGVLTSLVVTDEHGEQYYFAVRVVDWDEPTAHAAMIAANSKDVQGSYDWQALSMQMQDFEEMFGKDIDPTMFGMSEDTLAPLLAAEWNPVEIVEDAQNPNDNSSGEIKYTLTFDPFRWATIQAAMTHLKEDPAYTDKTNEELIEKIVSNWLSSTSVEDDAVGVGVEQHADTEQRLGDGPA